MYRYGRERGQGTELPYHKNTIWHEKQRDSLFLGTIPFTLCSGQEAGKDYSGAALQNSGGNQHRRNQRCCTHLSKMHWTKINNRGIRDAEQEVLRLWLLYVCRLL